MRAAEQAKKTEEVLSSVSFFWVKVETIRKQFSLTVSLSFSLSQSICIIKSLESPRKANFYIE